MLCRATLTCLRASSLPKRNMSILSSIFGIKPDPPAAETAALVPVPGTSASHDRVGAGAAPGSGKKKSKQTWKEFIQGRQLASNTVRAVLIAFPKGLTRREIYEESKNFPDLKQFNSFRHCRHVLSCMLRQKALHTRVSERSKDRFAPWVYQLGRRSRKFSYPTPDWYFVLGTTTNLTKGEKLRVKVFKDRLRRQGKIKTQKQIERVA